MNNTVLLVFPNKTRRNAAPYLKPAHWFGILQMVLESTLHIIVLCEVSAEREKTFKSLSQDSEVPYRRDQPFCVCTPGH